MARDKRTNKPGKAGTWKEFISNGKINDQVILPQIADSWMRCSQLALNPEDGCAQNILERADIRILLEKNQDIINIAKPFMANLYQFFYNSGFIVVLADVHGYVMECFGDRSSLTSARKIHFVPGASWREGDVGTNAIAVGLMTGKPVQVSGAEHYCRKHHWWTCSAAPIFNSEGEIVAFLDVSGPAQAAYSHTLGMVVAAADAVTTQLGMQQKNYELSLLNKRLSGIFNAVSDGVILFDRFGKVKEYNQNVQKILGKSSKIFNGIPIQTIFKNNSQLIHRLLDRKNSYTDIEFQFDDHTGAKHCILSGETIVDKQGDVNGGIIILRPVEPVYALPSRLSGHYTTFQFNDILGNSAAISEAVRQASAAAVTSSNIILQGESGTGKEMFAQAIHNKSSRRSGPFVALNCGAIPRELVGSELFGYEDGAFTGAKRGGKPGKFELASGGTLFLDEIGDMPLEQQVALLRVLQEKMVPRIGGNKVIPVDVRIICATNKDLNQLVASGAFRQDLYYRLNVFKIDIPPLRERQGDIELLFCHFVDKFGQEQGRDYTVDATVIEYLRQYSWPGNVRELHNIAERACTIAEANRISLACLPPELCCPKAGRCQETAMDNKKIKKRIEEQEFEKIRALLEAERGNISRVASQLGIARSTLYRKMKKYSIF
ncbi:sigma-54-dependent Fis family transcriptional regulator [Sporomusa acidovorans]|uniref:Acetoin dehydrogenase operon transcriptional activator AcoR n=1 Tax=Sporomusa acidovorans (strain ATCC 49682 / DSM 3132 / Mol) TaxID=1123286 RepID=A0ABZ3J5W3_SPOA4|nr:sigma-54-dependent Fis family transcriptional regulator [Sporomusa acidovorans]OZC15656.1 acetoin dehydrogenase operon transcriptional activator AcoR [Sporomusa acidovorans DSM 3132]SDE88312.1 PAS domain S-box-containing protein [Sporomusa acidovorans]